MKRKLWAVGQEQASNLPTRLHIPVHGGFPSACQRRDWPQRGTERARKPVRDKSDEQRRHLVAEPAINTAVKISWHLFKKLNELKILRSAYLFVCLFICLFSLSSTVFYYYYHYFFTAGYTCDLFAMSGVTKLRAIQEKISSVWRRDFFLICVFIYFLSFVCFILLTMTY